MKEGGEAMLRRTGQQGHRHRAAPRKGRERWMVASVGLCRKA